MYYKTLSLLAFPVAGLGFNFFSSLNAFQFESYCLISHSPHVCYFLSLKKSLLTIILVKHWKKQK